MPQLGSCASLGRTWQLWLARPSQGKAQSLGAQPLPRVLELAASKAADSTACDHPGMTTCSTCDCPRRSHPPHLRRRKSDDPASVYLLRGLVHVVVESLHVAAAVKA